MKTLLLVIAISTTPSFAAEPLTAEPSSAVNFVESKPTADEVETKAQVAKPLPKEPLKAEIADDKTEAEFCVSCQVGSPGTTPKHSVLSAIPLSTISK